MTPAATASPPRPARAAAGTDARALLQCAQGAFQKWPEGFRGFRAGVRCETDGRQACGHVVVTPAGVRADLDDRELAGIVSSTLASVVDERTPRFFKDGDGRFPLAVDGHDGDGLTVVVHRDDDTRLRYRVDTAGRLREVHRDVGELSTTVVFEAVVRATPGRVLPARTIVTVRTGRSGEVLHVQTIEETHVRVEHVWLPATRSVTVQAPVGAGCWRLTFIAHALL